MAAPAERRTRRRPGPAACHVSAGAPIASAASSGPAPRRSSTEWKSPATCSASASSYDARAEREQHEQVDVARAEQDGEAASRTAPRAGRRTAASTTARRRGASAARASSRPPAAARPRPEPGKPSASARRRASASSTRPSARSDRNAPRERARRCSSCCWPSRSIATASAARSVATRSKSSSGSSTASAIRRPHELSISRTSTISAPSGVSPRSSARCRSAHAPSATSSPDSAGHVVDELVPGVLEHDRVADRGRQLGEDLGHAAAVQDQLGEAAVDLLAAPQQLELAVEHGGVDRLGDLHEAHRAPEGHQRHAGLGARAHHRLGHALAPGRAELDRHGGGALLDQRGDPALLVTLPGARSDPRGEHQLAALEQVAGVGHLDHVRPAQLAIEALRARDHLRQRAAEDGQLEDVLEAQHTFRQPFWNKTRRCVHCRLRCNAERWRRVGG